MDIQNNVIFSHEETQIPTWDITYDKLGFTLELTMIKRGHSRVDSTCISLLVRLPGNTT